MFVVSWQIVYTCNVIIACDDVNEDLLLCRLTRLMTNNLIVK